MGIIVKYRRIIKYFAANKNTACLIVKVLYAAIDANVSIRQTENSKWK